MLGSDLPSDTMEGLECVDIYLREDHDLSLRLDHHKRVRVFEGVEDVDHEEEDDVVECTGGLGSDRRGDVTEKLDRYHWHVTPVESKCNLYGRREYNLVYFHLDCGLPL